MKIAIAQLNPTVGDLSGNAQLILKAAQTATDTGCDLLITPELSLVGYPPRDLLMRPSFVEATIHQLQGLAAALPSNLAVLVGTVYPRNSHEQGGKGLFNSAALLKDGQVSQVFHKRLLPTYDVFDEDRYFSPGLQSYAFKLENDSSNSIQVGVTICEDLWNDEEFWGKRNYSVNPIGDLAEKNVDLIVNLSASPYRANKPKFRRSMLGYSAKRYQLPLIYVNQVGGNDDIIFDGCSLVFNRTGEVVACLKAFDSDFGVIEFNAENHDLIIPKALEIDQSSQRMSRLESEEAEIWSALVLGVKDYVRKCRFSKVVLGLSGGIDSALVAAIATEALGKENVLGVLMPSPYSSEHSITDAQALAENLGIKTQILPIGNLMESFDQTLADIFAGTNFGLAEENIQSRIRGTLLMGISNKFGHLLLSTGNKSEVAVGYCTLYGDMNGGLAVIADVPKTKVYSICQWLNKSKKREIIPENVLIKPPSAELKPGQVDQDSLPPYPILDDILYRLIEQHQSVKEIVAAGHDEVVVQKVVKLVMMAEFKRRQAPPGLKISDRAFGTGWRMPIAKAISW